MERVPLVYYVVCAVHAQIVSNLQRVGIFESLGMFVATPNQ